MTQQEKQEIIDAVLAALQTNSRSISQMTPVTGLIDSDMFEVAGGKRILFKNLYETIAANIIADDMEGGEGLALGADQGHALCIKIDWLNDRLNDLIGALAGIAFTGGRLPQTDIDWGVAGLVKHTVALDTTGLDSCSIVEQYPKRIADGNDAIITIAPDSGKYLQSASYKIGESGESVSVNIVDNEAIITIPNVTEDITVYVTAAASDQVRFFDGYKFYNADSSVSSENLVEDADWCVSDYIPLTVNGVKAAGIFYGAGGSYSSHYLNIYNSNKEYLGHISLSNAYRFIGLSALVGYQNYAYIRICYPKAKRSSRYIYSPDLDAYLYKGDDYDGRYEQWGLEYGKFFINSNSSHGEASSNSCAVTGPVEANIVGDGSKVLKFWMGAYKVDDKDLFLEFLNDADEYTSHIGQNGNSARSWTVGNGYNLPKIRSSLYLPELDNCYVQFDGRLILAGLNIISAQ